MPHALTTTSTHGYVPPGPAGGMATFAEGEQFADILVPVLDDDWRQGVRTVVLQLTSGWGYTVETPDSGVIEITEDEPQDDVWVESVEDALEGGPAGYLRLRRWDAMTEQTVSYSLDSAETTATAGVDYAALSGSVTFAMGQSTIDVVIDASGPYFDAALEDDEVVAIGFTSPGAAFGGVYFVQVRDERPANQAPNFNVLGDFSFDLGERSGKDAIVGTTPATDPDFGDKVRYEITAGNAGGFFSIHPDTGVIKVARDLTYGTALVSNLTVRASDGRGGQATVQAVVTLKPMVLIYGDFYAVEAAVGTGGVLRDTARLDFRRLSRDVTQPLTATYSVLWGNGAGEADLENPAALVAAGATTGTVTFPANVSLVSITLRATQDAALEVAEKFWVTVARQGAAAYTTLLEESASMSLEAVSQGRPGVRDARITLLDQTTLFASQNATPNKPEWIDANGVGPALNDVMQGGIGDCYFLGAVGAMAQRSPGLLTQIRENADGTATYGYYPRGIANGVREVTVPMTLDYGRDQADLSMDHVDSATARAYEIWPQVFESVYTSIVTRPVFVDGGRASEVWTHLTGLPAEVGDVDAMTLAQVTAKFEGAINTGKKVTFSSRGADKNKDQLTVPGCTTPLVTGHVYVLSGILNGRAYFYNPWGIKHVNVALGDLARFFYRYNMQ